MKQTLIGTGLSGMVGSRFVELYANEFDFENLDITEGIDITDKPIVKEKIGESSGGVVVHFAAFTDVDKANEQKGNKQGLCYSLNVLGTRHVAQSCKLTGKRLIHISTDFVFDGEKTSPYTEADSPNPIEWYGQTKLWAEEEIQKSGVDYAIARITYPYRAHFPQKLDLVRSIIHKLKDGVLPPMFSNHIITPSFIDDIAIAVKAMVDQQTKGIFHVVGSTSVSDYQLATKIAEVFGLDPSQVKKGSLEKFLKSAKRPYPKRLATSNKKLKKELGISMSTLQEGLKKIKQQMKDHG